MYSNSKAIGLFDMGKLVFDYKNPEYKKHCTTIKKVTFKDGKEKKAFQGVKKKLKQSQQLGCNVVFFASTQPWVEQSMGTYGNPTMKDPLLLIGIWLILNTSMECRGMLIAIFKTYIWTSKTNVFEWRLNWMYNIYVGWVTRPNLMPSNVSLWRVVFPKMYL